MLHIRIIFASLLAGALLTLSGCDSGSQAALGEMREVDNSIRIEGFFADLYDGSVRRQRVMAENAVYDMENEIFRLENVRIHFFDEAGLTAVEELYAQEGQWYTGDHLDMARVRNDFDLFGDEEHPVFYQVLEEKNAAHPELRDALVSQQLYYDSQAEKLETDERFVMVLVGADAMRIIRGNGFITDRTFSQWKVIEGKIENTEQDFAKYSEIIPEPRADAPSFEDYGEL